MRSRHPLPTGFWLLGAVFAVAAVAPSQAKAPAQAAEKKRQEVVILGASLSAGFACPWPDEDGNPNRTERLKKALGSLWDRDTARVRDLSDLLTFQSPVKKQTPRVARAMKADPDLLLGIDFMFWFGYGSVWSPKRDARLERQQQAFAMLEKFDCPIVLGDYPDMTGADPRMLRQSQIPKPAVLKELNKRLHEWADARDHVTVFPLAEWVAQMKKEGRSVYVEDEEVQLGPKALLQSDRLHPTKLGLAVVVDGLTKILLTALPDDSPLRADDVEFTDVVEVVGAEEELEDAMAKPAKPVAPNADGGKKA